MKTRRILSMILAVMLVLTSIVTVPVFAAEFTDLTEAHDAYTAINILNKLGIINGYEDGSFKPDNNVTRAEFTALLLRTRGMGNIGSTSVDNPPFPDVVTSDVSWAIGNIRTAQGMGIINGYEDGTFRPKNNVSYEEAIKMIVCALGYENFGTPGNEWYAKYVMTANTLGFLEKSGGTIGTPATRATIAKMLYNCLELNLAENNEETEKTILENDLKLTKKVGIIASNSITSLAYPDTILRTNEIEINAPTDDGKTYSTLTYKVENAEDYKDMFGAQITFYYSEDKAADTRTVVLATTKNTDTLTINARDIETGRCDNSTIYYYKSADAATATSVSIDSAATVIYNDKLYGSNSASSTYATYYSEKSLPTIGSIKLLDRNGDSRYDIVFVEDYETYIVSSITTSNKTVVDNLFRKGMTNNSIKLDADAPNHEIKFVTADGKETSFENIRTGNVLSIKQSNPGNGGISYITVEINSNATINGTVKSTVIGETATINGEEYNYSYQAPWLAGTSATTGLTEPVMDDSGKYYLDRDGSIIAYNKEEVKTNQYYGYLMNVIPKADSIGEEKIYFNIIMASNGRKKQYQGYSKTKVNNQEQSSYNAIETALQTTAAANKTYTGAATNDGEAQLIKFTTTTYKNQEVIDNIITLTPVSTGMEVKSTALNLYATIDASMVSKYASATKKIYKDAVADANESVNLSSTLIINIPSDRTDEDSYRKMSLSDLKTAPDYKAEYYDVSTTKNAAVMLVYEGSVLSTAVTETSPFVIVTGDAKAKERNDEEGVQMYKLVGYDARNNVDITGWIAPESESAWANVKQGDVVRLGTNNKGYYTLDPKHIMFGPEVSRAAVELNGSAVGNGAYEEVIMGEGHTGSPRYRVIWGSVQAKDDTTLNVSKTIIDSTTTPTAADANVYSIDRSYLNSTRIYRYSNENGTFYMDEVDRAENAGTIDGLADPIWAEETDENGNTTYTLTREPSQVFVFLVSNVVRLMVIVD